MKIPLLALITATTLLLAGCDLAETAQASPPQGQAPSIEVLKARSFDVQPWKTYTSRIEAPEQVALRPRISGVVEAIHFVEGQAVKKDDLLITLDSRYLAARVDQLSAELASASAAVRQAENEYNRAKRLIQQQAISKEQAELRQSVAQQRRADVNSIKARLTQAELDLSYASIRAPIAGTISRAEITAGNTISANQSLLTNISSQQQRYAYFNMEERTWYRHYSKRENAISAPVVVQLIGEEGYPHRGVIDFVDNVIDESSGTLRIRAVLPDEEGQLLPGAFARVRLAVAKASAKVLVPDRAIATDLGNKFVLTVNEDNQATYTQVSLGERFGDYRVIESGLAEGVSVVINGTAKVGPGMTINPVEVDMDTHDLQLTLNAQLLNNTQTAAATR
ncbi:efflux RND transporter periplasmic adaptor subunit [Marinobacter sp. ANT_B65]|uniref:efflux RND transporter periplasmic adaptor subunit n=1 Tax=Marinobacter sp. ANT_B65 TaxID=2039467 RepID=UPI0015C94A23|nr:efflux RND transporter periplasmic adaptor subunit [Marinobacter sp. ANT_B65]